MPDFSYVARNTAGKQVTGMLSAGTEREAIAQLATKALFPVRVAVASTVQANSSLGVSAQVMANTYSQMAALLRSGVALMRTLAVLRDQSSNKNLKAVLDDVYRKVEDGSALAEVMAKYPRTFSEMAVNMVRAGQEGGFLEDALERVAKFTEQQEELKGRTIGAVAYPAILGTVGTLVVSGLIVFFVPKFAVMFDRLRQRGELPWATEALLFISDTTRSWGWLILLLLGSVVTWLYFRLQTEEGKRQRDWMLLKMPLGGTIFQAFAVARFCRVLGTLLHNGVAILKALEIARQAAGNRILSDAIEKASNEISAGKSLAGPLAGCGHFPKMVVEMIAVAEESNTLDKVLVEMADSLETRTSRQLDILVRLLEPLMLVVLAVVILIVVIALLVPVIKMSSTLG